MIEKMNYIFSDNSFHTRGFTWASSIHPRSEMVNRICPTCGTVEHYPSGSFDVTLEGGSIFPDVLGCGAYPFLIFSENVVRTLERAKITCFHLYNVGIAEIKSKKLMLQGLEPPHYYRVEIDGICHIDLAASGLEVVKYCPTCHHLVTKPRMANGLKLIEGSWDGSVMFRDHSLYPRMNFCTDAILELARANRFKNFRFEMLEGPWDTSSKGIQYLRI